MGVYIYQNGTETEMKNAYIGEYDPFYDGLLGYRPLQTDLKDYSGNGNDGSWFSGTGSFETVGGKTGARVTKQANTPNLSTQHIITTLNYQNAPITMAGWICFNSISVYNWGGLMSSSNESGKGYTMGTRPNDNNYPTAVLSTSLRIASSVPSTNTWYFWCATFEGTTMKTYLNGNLANTYTGSTLITAGGVWKLGCAMVDGGQTVNAGANGWVRHCAVYNRALTADEILEFYNKTS